MGEVASGKTTNVPIKERGNVEQLVEDGYQFVTEREVEEAGEKKVYDITHLLSFVFYDRHCAGIGFTSPCSLDASRACRKTERMDLCVNPVYPAAPSGRDADEHAFRFDVRELLHAAGYICDQPLKCTGHIECRHNGVKKVTVAGIYGTGGIP